MNNMQFKRFYEVVEERKNKIWTLSSLLKRINKMLMSNIEMSRQELITLINNQQRYKVFRNTTTVDGKSTIFYIFRLCLPNKDKGVD